jgi:hypothetical protein
MEFPFQHLPNDLIEKICNEYCDLDTRIKLGLPPRKIHSDILKKTEILFLNAQRNLTISSSRDDIIISKFGLSSDMKTIFHLSYIYSRMDNFFNIRFSSWKKSQLCYIQNDGDKLMIIPRLPSQNTIFFNYSDSLTISSKSYIGKFFISKEFKKILIENNLITI